MNGLYKIFLKTLLKKVNIKILKIVCIEPFKKFKLKWVKVNHMCKSLQVQQYVKHNKKVFYVFGLAPPSVILSRKKWNVKNYLEFVAFPF